MQNTGRLTFTQIPCPNEQSLWPPFVFNHTLPNYLQYYFDVLADRPLIPGAAADRRDRNSIS
jgi:hypothetical protein